MAQVSVYVHEEKFLQNLEFNVSFITATQTMLAIPQSAEPSRSTLP